jgi:hypothetical protein
MRKKSIFLIVLSVIVLGFQFYKFIVGIAPSHHSNISGWGLVLLFTVIYELKINKIID